MPAEPAELDPERRLALVYVGAGRRRALAALWQLDAAFGGLLATAGQPMIARIKIAWWREALQMLDQAPPPAEPVLRHVSERVLTAGVSGAELAAMADGWEYLAEPGLLANDSLDAYAHLRGGLLFRASAILLGAEADASVERAGEGWALVDLARRTGSREEGERALVAARMRLNPAFPWPVLLRPLGMLALLARRDTARGAGRNERRGSPARVARMFVHRLTGR